MAHILECSDRGFKIIVINILTCLVEKHMHEKIGNFGRQMQSIIKCQVPMLEMKNVLSEMKNSFNGLINRLNTEKEKIGKL